MTNDQIGKENLPPLSKIHSSYTTLNHKYSFQTLTQRNDTSTFFLSIEFKAIITKHIGNINLYQVNLFEVKDEHADLNCQYCLITFIGEWNLLCA